MSTPEKDAAKLQSAKKELEFLKQVARRVPEDPEILRALAELYTTTGSYAEGLQADQRLSHLCADDPMVWYNLGCSFALTERPEEALEALSRALELGYDDYEWMKKDADLTMLHGDARFESMLEWIYSTFEQTPES